jgi:UPF0755 protein
MLKNFFIALFLVILVGGLATFLALRHVRELRAQEQAALFHAYKKDVSVTIVEGKRREEIAKTLADAGICGYAEFLAASQKTEGTLFPDTYRFFPNTPASEIVAKMQDNYQTHIAALKPTREQMILASIIEREAVTDAERPQIAGVYTNRLAIDMKLDADPTVQYAKDSLAFSKLPNPQSYSFWSDITQDDYHGVKSSYNTYLSAGLPPGPISNPGIKSIMAAQNPTKSDYYYFLQKNGKILLSKTLNEHLAKAAAN